MLVAAEGGEVILDLGDLFALETAEGQRVGRGQADAAVGLGCAGRRAGR